MKKLLIFTLTAAMLLSLAACAQSAKPAAEPEQTAQTEMTEKSTPRTFRSRTRGRITIRSRMPRRPLALI